MTSRSSKALAQAEAKFKKKAADADSAAAEIRAERLAVQDKIARLRALRLAKEAADQEAAHSSPVTKK